MRQHQRCNDVTYPLLGLTTVASSSPVLPTGNGVATASRCCPAERQVNNASRRRTCVELGRALVSVSPKQQRRTPVGGSGTRRILARHRDLPCLDEVYSNPMKLQGRGP